MKGASGLAALAAGAWLAAAAPVAADDAEAMAVAKGFYAVYATFHPSDGIPDAKTRARLDPFISPALDALLTDGEAADRRFAAATRHVSPPLIEGDLFTSNFEGATSYQVEPCDVAAGTARCPVALVYRGGTGKDTKPLNWTDTLYLVRTAEGWRVDDIGYGGSWDFGNKGRMSETLKSAIRDGNGAAP